MTFRVRTAIISDQRTVALGLFAVATFGVVVSPTLTSFGRSARCFADGITVAGKIAFPDGQVPAYLSVTLGNDAFTKETGADSSGNYSFADVPPGTYLLVGFGSSSSRAGFAQQTIQVPADQSSPLNIDLVLSSTAPAASSTLTPTLSPTPQ